MHLLICLFGLVTISEFENNFSTKPKRIYKFVSMMKVVYASVEV